MRKGANQYDTPSAVERYRLHGNKRPSQQKLETIREQISGSHKVSVALICADVCIDLAMADREHANAWVEKAREELTDTLETCDLIRSSMDGRSSTQALGQVTLARLRMSELDNWLAAARGETPTLSYEGSVEALDAIYEAAADSATTVRSRLLEYMPVLLGARRQARVGSSWVGRLALDREDNRVQNVRGQNGSWDCGVDSTPTAEGFAFPAVRLQMKASSRNGVTRYNEAGVTLITAKQCGFNSPQSVFLGCMNEFEPVGALSNPNGVPVFSSDQLDEITERFVSTLPDIFNLDAPEVGSTVA